MSDSFLGQDMSADIRSPIPTGTVYEDKALWPGTFIGGPLVAGYIIAENFEAFDEHGNAVATWIITILSTLFIFVISYSATMVAQKAIFGVYSAVAYMLLRYHQGKRIDAHIRAGGATHSWPKVFGVSVIGALISFIPAFLMVAGAADTRATRGPGGPVVSYAEEPPPPPIEPPASKEYGAVRNEVYFLRSNISEEEVDMLAAALTKTGFLKGAPQKFLYIKKLGENYEIYISCNSTVETDPNAYKEFVPVWKRMQKLLPGKKVVFNLAVGTIDNVAKRIE